MVLHLAAGALWYCWRGVLCPGPCPTCLGVRPAPRLGVVPVPCLGVRPVLCLGVIWYCWRGVIWLGVLPTARDAGARLPRPLSRGIAFAPAPTCRGVLPPLCPLPPPLAYTPRGVPWMLCAGVRCCPNCCRGVEPWLNMRGVPLADPAGELRPEESPCSLISRSLRCLARISTLPLRYSESEASHHRRRSVRLQAGARLSHEQAGGAGMVLPSSLQGWCGAQGNGTSQGCIQPLY